MEEKQLDFNQPLLSVRRYSATPGPAEAQERRRKVVSSLHKLPPLPTYKSELKSGPIRNPGNVPFVWERIPGKPKEEKELHDHTVVECPPAAPKPPPGRSPKTELKHQDSDKDCIVVTGVDPQRSNKTQSVAQEATKHGPKHEEEIGDKGGSSSEEGDEAFLDARDTFSRSDSFFLNSSVISGLCGLDGPDWKSSEGFNADPGAWDFMMSRFLPAAKAMASEMPHHTSRKPLPVAQEIPRPKKLSDNVVKEDCPVVDQGRPKVPLRYILNEFREESEDDDWDDYENTPAKVCGLLPRFCMLNPVPGIKTMQPPMPHSARRARGKSSYKDSVAENRTKRAPCEELKERRLDSGSKLGEASSGEDGDNLEGSNLYKQLQGNGQILNRKEVSLRAAFEAENSVGTAAGKLNDSSVDGMFNPLERRCMNFRELLASEGSGWESRSTGPVVEKTLYVDSVHLVKSRNSDTCSSDSKGLNNQDDNAAALLKSSCLETKHQFDLPNDVLIESEPKKITDFSPLPSDKSDCEAQIDPIISSTDDRHLTVEAKAKNCGEACGDGKIDLDSESATKVEGRQISLISNSKFHLPPPLPKSPSDSWLSRTLLAVSSKNSASSKTPLGTNIVSSRKAVLSKSPPIETKWETIVRTSNVHYGHLRSSKELLPPIPDA
ncbi:uncharacterized protein LOC116197006 [Punica granatum]|uniref:Uncharacterized protein LOC116197006 n=2 Tax=Punica granatum TaxID=22663 RepID=A0A6P8CSV0_PUNGR|nr:uncharacterized protein LOC116197006 [Punica granatum]XP_031382853.1 uncharacterized protein LOC116197006 [Punica granatum]XP_031382854.1 uncharacterized protein LOC116197006 [Punica granatum]PKI42773.1 hypothetical protein CRG98_036901 [Punica granatum]